MLVDLDGTVVDYSRTEAGALTAIYKEFFGDHTEYRNFVLSFHECNAAVWAAYRQHEISLDVLRTQRFERLIRQLGLPGMADALPPVVARFESELGRRAELFTDSAAALRALRSAARLVLVTDGIAAVQRAKLARTRLRKFFEHVVISSEVGYRKPDPALLRHALRCVGADRRAALMVGDSPASDGAAARAAGIDFCWVNRAHPAPRDLRSHIPSLSFPPPAQCPARFQVPDLASLATRLPGL